MAREYLVAFTKAVGMPISPVVPLPFNTTPNSTNPIYTLWNYLYIAEGSDWTWQTGPPNYGPVWFQEQALTYTSAIINKSHDKTITYNTANLTIPAHNPMPGWVL